MVSANTCYNLFLEKMSGSSLNLKNYSTGAKGERFKFLTGKDVLVPGDSTGSHVKIFAESERPIPLFAVGLHCSKGAECEQTFTWGNFELFLACSNSRRWPKVVGVFPSSNGRPGVEKDRVGPAFLSNVYEKPGEVICNSWQPAGYWGSVTCIMAKLTKVTDIIIVDPVSNPVEPNSSSLGGLHNILHGPVEEVYKSSAAVVRYTTAYVVSSPYLIITMPMGADGKRL